MLNLCLVIVRKISNHLQVFDLCMYQLPLAYPCAGKKGGTGPFFIYTALYQLTKLAICSQSACVTLCVPAWCRRWRQGQAGPCLRAMADPCRSGSPSMKSALGTSQQQEMKLLQNQRETLFVSALSYYFSSSLVRSSAWRLHKKVFAVNAMNTLIQKNTAMTWKH